ncbi:MAG: glutamate--tRNA ligase [Chloroflexi bacterium RBG_16_64_32]|nr:MAG: glutamate--tRNA ligase [Chloroflexi bacterium RBG_16_64_32]
MSVRVRYAPSPTGEPHVGNIRTALFNWLFARHEGGAFIVRLEDTDQARYEEGAERAIFESLAWLGLDYDEGPDPSDISRDIGDRGPYVQSRRRDTYRRHADQLIEAGHAYRCYCPAERLDQVRKDLQRRKLPPKYDRHCRDLPDPPGAEQRLESEGLPCVVRFRTPLSGQTAFHDLIRGDIMFQNDTLDDFVLMKSDGFPVYHLASVVDDRLMGISHVLRGDEWLSSTPRHVLLYQAFDWEPPAFAHLPMILGPDRSKLSKRHGDTAVLEFRERGFLPEALLNFLGLLGWSLDDRTEIIDRETFVRSFGLERVLANPAVFNFDKLTWMNGVYIRELAEEALADRISPVLESRLGTSVDRGLLRRVVPLIRERIKLLTEAVEMAGFFFVEGELDYGEETLLGKKFAGDPGAAAHALEAVLGRVSALQPWEHGALEGAIRPLAEELDLKTGALFGLIRVAVTGSTAAPPLFETMAVLGRERSLERLRSALRRLGP